MKVATFDANRDLFKINLHKSAGHLHGVRISATYNSSDFDYLLVILPLHEKLEHIATGAYLFPVASLVQRALVDKVGVSSTAMSLYPHRETRHNCYRDARWTEAYSLDFTSPATAIAAYHRIVCAE